MAEKTIELGSLDPSEGFKISGATGGDLAGWSVSSAGDINGDGIEDVVVGAYSADNDTGAAYVVYGSETGLADVDLADLTAEQGFKISGEADFDQAGRSISSAGDVNGDGIDDIIVGAPGANSSVGAAYVVYGSAEGLADIDLDDLTAEQGFEITGVEANSAFGSSVSSAGDINGDGIDDVFIGAPASDVYTGAAYVIYGSEDGLGDIDLADLTAEQGFAISGQNLWENTGNSVSSAGDVNGDGIDDIIIGSEGAEDYAGVAYVIYGSEGGLADIDLADLTAEQGFVITGEPDYGYAGRSVSGAGDVNGDGIDDIVVGAFGVDANAGAAYVVYGSEGNSADIDLADLTPEQGFKISGAVQGDIAGWDVSSAGDVNGDGVDDILLGAYGADDYNGAAYVVYGSAEGLAGIDLAELTADQGFEIKAEAEGDNAGYDVSAAGDVNGDGYDDVLVGSGNDAEGRSDAGAAYVVYGFSTAAPPVVEIGAPSATLVEDDVLLAAAAVTVTGTAAEVDAEAMAAAGWTETSEGVWEQAGVYGTATFDEASGEIAYAVDNGSDAVQALNDDESVEEAFSITYANDDGSDSANVTFTLFGMDEIVEGTEDNDDLSGTKFGDRMLGYGGDDILLGSAGADEMLGGGGFDTASYAGSHEAVDINLGTWNATGGDAEGDKFESIEKIVGSAHDDRLTGDGTANWLYGGAGDDTLSGGQLDDTLNGGAGADDLFGGGGFDIAAYDGSGEAVTINLGTGTVSGGDADGDQVDSIEGVVGSDHDDSLTGDGGSNSLSGGAGDDLLVGGAGADQLLGGDGFDTASYADAGGPISVNLANGAGTGGDAQGDTLSSIEAVIGSDYGDVLIGDVFAETLIGGQGADSLYGGEGADELDGGNHADHLDGGAGADMMKGGAGNDTYVVDNAGDQVIEQANFGSHDSVEASVSFTLGRFVEKLTLAGDAAIDGTGNDLANVVNGNAGANTLAGLAGDDVLRGNAGADVLDGGTGADTMIGGAGDDTYYVDDAGDVVTEASGGTSAGSDTVVSTITYALGDYLEALTLAGSADIDGTGNAIRNTLVGNDGANILDGGLGNDVLTGGEGEDGFLFSTAPSADNLDTITDFTVGDDTILLDDAVFTALGQGAVEADDFAYLNQATGDEHLLYNAQTGRLFYDADGAGGEDRILIAKLDNIAAITHDDLFVV